MEFLYAKVRRKHTTLSLGVGARRKGSPTDVVRADRTFQVNATPLPG
jgi:hypothetical protein